MKRKVRRFIAGVAAAMIVAPAGCLAQEKVEATVGADLVSGYVWRGQELGGVSVQPSLAVGWKGLSLGAWGSVGFDKDDTKEFDLTLGYSAGGFNVSLTDYYFNTGAGYFHYQADKTAHVFEAHVGYDFGVAAVNWYTNIGGDDGVKAGGGRAYSSYVEVAAPFKLGSIDWTAEVGATPWETSFYDAGGFAVCNVSLRAGKEIAINERFKLPVFVKATWNLRSEGAYFVAGISL